MFRSFFSILFIRSTIDFRLLLQARHGRRKGTVCDRARAFEEAREAVRAAFAKAKVVRPKATRDESYEIFLCGLERQGEELASEETPPEGDEEGSG